MADNGIVTLELETTAGTFYTLWAPGWVSRGEEWQAFLGDDTGVFGFSSPLNSSPTSSPAATTTWSTTRGGRLSSRGPSPR